MSSSIEKRPKLSQRVDTGKQIEKNHVRVIQNAKLSKVDESWYFRLSVGSHCAFSLYLATERLLGREMLQSPLS